MRHAAPLLAALAALALLPAMGCARFAGRRGAIDASRYVPRTDAQLRADLGGYPSPGHTPSNDIHDTLGHLVTPPTDMGAFADEVIAYEPGIPAPIPEAEDPTAALGPPDYEVERWHKPRAVTLGNGGSITLGFSHGVLVDNDGPDLFIFEIGPGVEAMTVEISADGKTWISVGEAPGGPCAIDIHKYVEPGAAFRYVRIHDVPFQGAESDVWPGADIDAVGVMGGAERVALPSEVLFEHDSDTLAAGAGPALDRVVSSVQWRLEAQVSVEGHTDDQGAEEYNQRLSERRARAVAEYLISKGIEGERITTRGFGESRPIGLNDSAIGRQKNRRVEIVIRGR
jgi:outer membrane protein OmpA-like peptidoglycan-associated protein